MSVVDETAVLDALTLHPRSASGHKSYLSEQPCNLVCVHVPSNSGKDTEIELFLNGHSLGWLSAVKLAKLCQSIKTLTNPE